MEKMKMRNALLTVLLCLFAAMTARAQGADYGDVAVIVNDNSPASLAIGAYYASHRNIPSSRVIHVSTSTAKVIDSLQFRDLQAQIEAALISGNLLDTVQYLVTTKGMPMRVSVRNGCDSLDIIPGSPFLRCSCMEDVMSLILSPLDSMILRIPPAANPYFQATVPYSRDSFGLFIVTRLDGYTEADVYALIDRSYLGMPYAPQSSEVVMDYFGTNLGSVAGFFANTIFPQLELACNNLGLQTVKDTLSSFLIQNRTNVLYYFANLEDSTPPQQFQYLDGAIAHLVQPASLDSFTAPATQAFQMIRDGASGVLAHTSLYYYSTGFLTSIFAERYLDTNAIASMHFADAAFASTPTIGLSDLIIGDPKMRLISNLPAASPELVYGPDAFGFILYPNPASGNTVEINGLSPSFAPVMMRVVDALGRELRAQLIGVNYEHAFKATLNVDELPAGIYSVSLQQGAKRLAKQMVVLD